MARAAVKVPPVDAQSADNEPSGLERDTFEFRLLAADAKARENRNREADQRYWLRWIAVAVVLIIIAMMALLLDHVGHWLPGRDIAVGVVIALHLAPIVSMSTLAIALLVAAFRGFKDGDEEVGTSIAAGAAKASGLS